jgi:hypothetical protein
VKIVTLDERSRQQQVDDKCFAFIQDVPTHAVTVTIPALLAARTIFCTVPGPQKNHAIRNMLELRFGQPPRSGFIPSARSTSIPTPLARFLSMATVRSECPCTRNELIETPEGIRCFAGIAYHGEVFFEGLHKRKGTRATSPPSQVRAV